MKSVPRRTMGVLKITHVKSNFSYIARSSDIKSYYTRLLKWLRDGLLENKKFQEAYNLDPELTVEYKITADLDEAIRIQKEWVASCLDHLFNIPNSTGLALGIRNRILSDNTLPNISIESGCFLGDVELPLNDDTSNGILNGRTIDYVTRDKEILRGEMLRVSLSLMPKLPKKGQYLYCITNLQKTFVYVGSTIDLMTRTTAHMSSLVSGVHRNKHLQEAYESGECSELILIFISFKEQVSRPQLFGLEQDLLDSLKTKDDSLLICNISQDTSKFGIGLERSQQFRDTVGHAQSRPVSCEGVIYNSLTLAAKAYKCSNSKMWKMLNSPSEEFSNFHYMTSGKNHKFLFFESDEECETSYADRDGKYMHQTGVVLPRI